MTSCWSALNEQSAQGQCEIVIQVFQDSLLKNSAAYRMGIPAVSLSRLYQKLPVKKLLLGTRYDGVGLFGEACDRGADW